MSEILRSGAVYIQNKYAGLIKETDEGYEFTYDAAYINGDNPLCVSITLPICEEPYRQSTLFSFFDGLIPEGWLLNVVGNNWKINPADRFGILLVACRDCIGDVCIREVTP